MEYYHLHTKGIHDREYRESRVFVIDPEKFNNRLYDKCVNFSVTVPSSDFPRMVSVINERLRENHYKEYDDKVILTDLFSSALYDGISKEELIKLFESTTKFLVRAQIYKRENALEEYRKNNCNDKPSRMHSLYLTTLDGLDYWEKQLVDNDTDVYLVEVDHEPSVFNEQFLPEETLTYKEAYDKAPNYWFPKLDRVNPLTNEYLYQGKVRLVKKVGEIKKK